MSKFDKINPYGERFANRLQAPSFRVKINRWFTPESVEDESGLMVLSAAKIASRFGNRDISRQLRQHYDAELAIDTDLQGVYYKSALGLLAIGEDINPVRLETLNTDGETGLPMVQHALIDVREHEKHGVQIKFR